MRNAAGPGHVRLFYQIGGSMFCVSEPIEDPPGVRSGSLGSLYLAYVRGPDSNKLCALHFMK